MNTESSANNVCAAYYIYFRTINLFSQHCDYFYFLIKNDIKILCKTNIL